MVQALETLPDDPAALKAIIRAQQEETVRITASVRAYESKYDDHLPLYRQGEILARMGADIPRSTLIDWCGRGVAALTPLIARIRTIVMATDRLHGDDTPIRVLDPSVPATRGRKRAVQEGRIWAYVRDDRPWDGPDPPAVACSFSPDRKGEHPRKHLAEFEGILQADAGACPRAGPRPDPGAGFRKLYEPRPDETRRVREAASYAKRHPSGRSIANETQYRPQSGYAAVLIEVPP